MERFAVICEKEDAAEDEDELRSSSLGDAREMTSSSVGRGLGIAATWAELTGAMPKEGMVWAA
jgi:hypothetical protein